MINDAISRARQALQAPPNYLTAAIVIMVVGGLQMKLGADVTKLTWVTGAGATIMVALAIFFMPRHFRLQ